MQFGDVTVDRRCPTCCIVRSVTLLFAALATVAGALATASVNRWASARADRVRRFSPEDADRMEQIRMTGRRAMRVPGFDKPR